MVSTARGGGGGDSQFCTMTRIQGMSNMPPSLFHSLSIMVTKRSCYCCVLTRIEMTIELDALITL
jgi:hypothetical protein